MILNTNIFSRIDIFQDIHLCVYFHFQSFSIKFPY